MFFGRTRAIGHVLESVRRQMAAKRAFVLVLGMSGCGKSSLVRAGVLPYLVLPGVIEGVGLWRRAVMRPSDAGIDLFRALAQALLREDALPELSADGTKAEELAAMLMENPTGADPLIKGALSQTAFAVQQAERLDDQPRARLVLVVDQLEEIWTLEGITAGTRADFVRTLASLSRSGRVAVVATLRSDFYHRCEELPELMELKVGAGEYQLQPPTPAEIGQMVRLPALAVGLRYEVEVETGARLDDVLRDAAARSPEALPLLEFALDELYEIGKVDGLLSFAEYEQIGSLEGAIARRAERSFEAFVEGQKLHGAEAEHLLGALFQSLVAVGQDSDSVTRRYAALDTLRESSGLLSALIDAFVDARLLTTGRTDDGTNTLSVAHETLLERWERLRDWIARNRELLIIRQRVADAAARWETAGRPHDLRLAQGLPVAEAEAFIQRRDALIDPAATEYVQRSATHWQRIGKRRRRIAATVAFVVGLLLVGVAAVSLYAYVHAEHDAQRIAEERDRVEEQREQATQRCALDLLPEDDVNRSDYEVHLAEYQAALAKE